MAFSDTAAISWTLVQAYATCPNKQVVFKNQTSDNFDLSAESLKSIIWPRVCG